MIACDDVLTKGLHSVGQEPTTWLSASRAVNFRAWVRTGVVLLSCSHSHTPRHFAVLRVTPNSCMNLAEALAILCPFPNAYMTAQTLPSPAKGNYLSFGRSQLGPIDPMVRRSEHSHTRSRRFPRTLGRKAGNYGVRTSWDHPCGTFSASTPCSGVH